MTKSQSIIVFLLLMVLLGFVGFLAWQVAILRTDYGRLTANNQGQAVNDKKISDEITTIKDKLKVQEETIKEFASQMSTLSTRLKTDLRKEFIPSPEYVSSVPMFTSQNSEDGNFKITGDLGALDAWENRNKLFLDYIIQESLVLDFDSTKQKFTVTNIIPNSVFFQMGLRKGDIISTLDKKPVINGDDLKLRLMEPVPTQVEVLRGDKKIAFAIAYAATNPDQAGLGVTRNEFNAALPKLLNSLEIMPAMDDGKVIGVKIVSLEATNVFSLMNFKSEDIITKVNDKTVTPMELMDKLGGDSPTLKIDFIRAGKNKNVAVSFTE
jgi:S1-C subfamily serine protease